MSKSPDKSKSDCLFIQNIQYMLNYRHRRPKVKPEIYGLSGRIGHQKITGLKVSVRQKKEK